VTGRGSLSAPAIPVTAGGREKIEMAKISKGRLKCQRSMADGGEDGGSVENLASMARNIEA